MHLARRTLAIVTVSRLLDSAMLTHQRLSKGDAQCEIMPSFAQIAAGYNFFRLLFPAPSLELQYKRESSYPLLKTLVPEPISGPTLLKFLHELLAAISGSPGERMPKSLLLQAASMTSPRFGLTRYFRT